LSGAQPSEEVAAGAEEVEALRFMGVISQMSTRSSSLEVCWKKKKNSTTQRISNCPQLLAHLWGNKQPGRCKKGAIWRKRHSADCFGVLA